MSCSSSVRGSGIFLYHSESTTRWHVEQERVPSHAPDGCKRKLVSTDHPMQRKVIAKV